MALFDIKKVEEDALAEIRERERRRSQSEAGEREIFHAQILSFAK